MRGIGAAGFRSRPAVNRWAGGPSLGRGLPLPKRRRARGTGGGKAASKAAALPGSQRRFPAPLPSWHLHAAAPGRSPRLGLSREDFAFSERPKTPGLGPCPPPPPAPGGKCVGEKSEAIPAVQPRNGCPNRARFLWPAPAPPPSHPEAKRAAPEAELPSPSWEAQPSPRRVGLAPQWSPKLGAREVTPAALRFLGKRSPARRGSGPEEPLQLGGADGQPARPRRPGRAPAHLAG